MRGMMRLAIMGVPGAQSGGATIDPELAALLSKFEAAGDEVGIYKSIPYIGATSYTYHLMQALGDGRYVDRTYPLAAVGTTYTRVMTTEIGRLLWWTNDNDPALVKVGSWVRSNNVGYIGGGYSYTNSTGGYVEWTTNDNVTHLWVASVPAGVTLVSIDGDTTLANKLPTAQDLVDAETLPETVLVANGGTLNPTDRVWNSYATGTGLVEIADNLTPGVHILRLTRTGYKQDETFAAWLAFHALFEWGANAGFDLGTPFFWFLRDQYVRSTTSVDEISYRHQPEGTSVAEWLGHTNWLLQKTPPVITVDGEVVEIDAYYHGAPILPVRGSKVQITFEADGRHPQMGEINTALVEMEYRAETKSGYYVKHRTTWLTNGFTTGTYPAMMGYDVGAVDRCAALDSVADVPIVQDGQTKCETTTAAMWIWKSTGNVGALLYIPNLDAIKALWPGFKISLPDTAVAKLYASFAVGQVYSTNDEWNFEANYRFQWFSDGANAALSVE